MKELKEKYYSLFKSELFDSCIPFWLKNSKDDKFGGITNCVDRFGKIYSTDKSVWMQGRCAWTYSYICNSFGVNDEFLAFAKSCLDFENKSRCLITILVWVHLFESDS